MDWFLYDNGLRHERVKQIKDQTEEMHKIHLRSSFKVLSIVY